MNITPEEQRALVQFFGTVHAQAKQTDQMIVGHSQFVKPVSPKIQEELEHALRIPVVQENNTPRQYSEPVPVMEVKADRALQELQAMQHPEMVSTPVSSPQLDVKYNSSSVEDSNNLIKALEEINLSLNRIGDILEKNGQRRSKNQKSH